MDVVLTKIFEYEVENKTADGSSSEYKLNNKGAK